MKKSLLFIIACFASASMFAAGEHYQINNQGMGSQYTKLNGVLVIDGVEQANPNLEIGVFDQDGICRGAKKPTKRQATGQYIYLLQIRGNDGFTYTFRVWDHATGTELDLVDNVVDEDGNQITYQGNYTYQYNGANTSMTNPLPLNFATPSAGFEKGIVGYSSASGNGSNWYLVASPVGEVTPSADNGFVTDAFDLYYFDQDPDDGVNEWMNYEATSDGFPIETGKGYLYASADTTTLVFGGDAYTTETGELEVPLAYSENTEFSGWNLVGNPFGEDAYIGTAAYYRMKDDGTDLITDPVTGTAIAPMEGVFVVATGAGQSVTFSTAEPDAAVPTLALNVSRDSKVIDRAVVSFGQERALPKFQLNPSHTKVYIPQESRDYAVVTAEEMGEMPVNFKAESNGRYTLDFTAQAVTFNYLHLIDNKTGKDVDLLESPAYSFDALTTDYATRFKLVFATGNDNGDSFAFNSNGLWIISNEGEATLQVVDVTGRILSSETISGSCSKAVSAAPGVYMLRLINGDNMKVQKVVVK